jgi:1-deoxy-D-xylulose-5-phosphate reductoisomerase
VTFADGAMVAGMGMPDMSVPIAHCLGFPDRLSTSVRRVDLAAIGRLDFEPPDLARFPALRLAMAALAGGGTLPAVLNAANEVAVQAFLAGSLRFGAIPRLIEAVMDSMGEAGARSVPCDMEAALKVDGMARREARAQLETVSNLAH